MTAARTAGAAIACVAGLLLAAPPAWAQADLSGRGPPRTRMLAGLIGGAAIFGDLAATTPHGGGGPSESTPREAGDPGNAATMGFVVGYERRFLDHWSLAVTWSLESWSLGAAVDAGYRFRRLDLGVAPQWEFFSWWGGGSFRFSSYLAMPVGLSEPFVSVPARRAFDEQLDSRLGWYAGGAMGVSALWENFGFRIEGGYCRHANTTRTTITFPDAGTAPLVEERSVVDAQLLFTFAALFAF